MYFNSSQFVVKTALSTPNLGLLTICPEILIPLFSLLIYSWVFHLLYNCQKFDLVESLIKLYQEDSHDHTWEYCILLTSRLLFCTVRYIVIVSYLDVHLCLFWIIPVLMVCVCRGLIRGGIMLFSIMVLLSLYSSLVVRFVEIASLLILLTFWSSCHLFLLPLPFLSQGYFWFMLPSYLEVIRNLHYKFSFFRLCSLLWLLCFPTLIHTKLSQMPIPPVLFLLYIQFCFHDYPLTQWFIFRVWFPF